MTKKFYVRIERIVSKENNASILYKLTAIFLKNAKHYEYFFYKGNFLIRYIFRSEFCESSLIVKTIFDLHDLSSNMFFSVVSSNMQKILSNVFII